MSRGVFRRCPLPLVELKVTVVVLISMEPYQGYVLQSVESKEKDGSRENIR